MNRDTMNKKFTEFRQIQAVPKKHYDIKKIKKYFIIQLQFHGMQKIVMILSNIQHMIKCYTIHLHIVMIFIDPHSLVKYSSSFTSHKRKKCYSNQKLKIDLNQKPPSLDHYRSMTLI
jgi:hypothetical protein